MSGASTKSVSGGVGRMLTELFMGISGVLTAIMVSLILYACTLCRENTLLSETVEAYQKDDKTIHDMEREVQEKDEQIKRLKYLLHEANERADRNAAIAQGLGEELAALKEYDPEEVEEQLKKIREIRAEEERKANEEKLKQSIDLAILNAQLNILAGTPVQIAQQSIYDRRTAANYGVMW